MPNETVDIQVFWDPSGFPTANDTTVRAALNSAVTITWSPGPGIASIDAFNFTSNPNGSITPPVKRNGVWTAVDTVKGHDQLKYLVQATNTAGTRAWSPDPMIENEPE